MLLTRYIAVKVCVLFMPSTETFYNHFVLSYVKCGSIFVDIHYNELVEKWELAITFRLDSENFTKLFASK